MFAEDFDNILTTGYAFKSKIAKLQRMYPRVVESLAKEIANAEQFNFGQLKTIESQKIQKGLECHDKLRVALQRNNNLLNDIRIAEHQLQELDQKITQQFIQQQRKP